MRFKSVHRKLPRLRMQTRRLHAAADFFRFSPRLLPLRLLPRWMLLSLAVNGCLLGVLALLLLRSIHWSSSSSAVALTKPSSAAVAASTSLIPDLGIRHQLTYQQWVDQLRQEATVMADRKPPHLAILAGDSISLWFPQSLLPRKEQWLNQGISGETSTGLLKRLDTFDQTRPETIFVMVGINDLIHGSDDQTILDSQEQIIRYLLDVHPHAQIVVQSILPHAGSQVTWKGRDRLLAVSNHRIQTLNRDLEAIAHQENVYFLNLYPLFADGQGDLRSDLTTDGLHLSAQGYQVWSIALQVYSQEVLAPER